jgi:hypothetical protein
MERLFPSAIPVYDVAAHSSECLDERYPGLRPHNLVPTSPEDLKGNPYFNPKVVGDFVIQHQQQLEYRLGLAQYQLANSSQCFVKFEVEPGGESAGLHMIGRGLQRAHGAESHHPNRAWFVGITEVKPSTFVPALQQLGIQGAFSPRSIGEIIQILSMTLLREQRPLPIGLMRGVKMWYACWSPSNVKFRPIYLETARLLRGSSSVMELSEDSMMFF